LIAAEKHSGARYRTGKLHYETPMSSTAASASPNCINNTPVAAQSAARTSASLLHRHSQYPGVRVA
jgi:hypothetical protein